MLLAGSVLMFSWRHGPPPTSFKAFYCAGYVVDHHGDPYRVEPLRSCEHTVAPGTFPDFAVEPAPLPGYAIAPFAVMAVLPYGAAHAVFLLLSLAALLGTGLGVAALTRSNAAACTLAFIALWYLNVQYGEVPPIAVAGIVLSAYALQRDRPWLVASGALLASIEPHIALPLWASLFLFYRQVRVPLILWGVALVGLDVSMGGPVRAAEYARVLQLQALSEVHANDQFSLTHQLALLGVGDVNALMLGSISYVIMVIVGLLVARKLSSTTGFPDYLALVPPAFVLLGGTFVHDVQFMAALPLAVVALIRRPGTALAGSALLLCIAWGSGASRLGFTMSALSAASIVWIASHGRSRASQMTWATAAIALVALAVLLNLRPAPRFVAATAPQVTVAATAWSPTAWRAYLESSPDRTTPRLTDFARKAPVWIALIVLLIEVGAASVRRTVPDVAPRLS